MAPFRNILVANRGEIAIRILRTARALGYRTTAVYSEADADAPHVALADVAVPIGPASVTASYLNIEHIISAARRAGADAVHPGYGLLSENAAFARACADAGLVFIGPRPETIELMGDKRGARLAVQASGVACIPGYDGEAQEDTVLCTEAQRIGFPIMVKATAGGGGRGMRRANTFAELPEAIVRARSEAQKAFGNGRLILERAIDGARHIELQVVADTHGHVLHLGERDCSTQRRFQKVLEEAPSPWVDAKLRERMGATAVLIAGRAGYVGVGTVEFLLDPGGRFYFLEMNTRLQVEHPVTELVTGLDLVELQLRIAQGEALAFTQQDVKLQGHAIEARLYAEDPAREFAPSTGRVLGLSLPEGAGIRIDHGLCDGLVIGPHYDAMLAKVIAHGQTREQARMRLCNALDRLRLLGVQTNQAFLREILEHPDFAAGTVTTDFLDTQSRTSAPAPPSMRSVACAALAFVTRARVNAAYAPELAEHTNCAGLAWPLLLETGDLQVALLVEPQPHTRELCVHWQGQQVQAKLVQHEAGSCEVLIGGVRSRFTHAWDGERLWVHGSDGVHAFRDLTHVPLQTSTGLVSGRAVAPMDGAVIDVRACVGDRVARGDTLAVIEAMKLELRVVADTDGVVAAVHIKLGDHVKARQLLVTLTACEEPAA